MHIHNYKHGNVYNLNFILYICIGNPNVTSSAADLLQVYAYIAEFVNRICT